MWIICSMILYHKVSEGNKYKKNLVFGSWRLAKDRESIKGSTCEVVENIKCDEL